MMLRKILNISLFYVGLWLMTQSALAQTCTFVGTPWTLNVTSADVTDAGLNVTSSYTSASDQTEFNLYYGFLTELFNNYSWNVRVQLASGSLPSGVSLQIRRTGDGTPRWVTGPITGGTGWITIPTSGSVAFFNGSRGREDVPLQYRFQGVSVTVPAGSYTPEITFTVTTSL